MIIQHIKGRGKKEEGRRKREEGRRKKGGTLMRNNK
jgi:hypothetical protein